MNTIAKTKDDPPKKKDAEELKEIWTEEDAKALEAALAVIKEAQERIKVRESQITKNNERIVEIERRLLEIEKEEKVKKEARKQEKKEKKENKESSGALDYVKKILRIGTIAAVLSTTAGDTRINQNIETGNDKNKIEMEKPKPKPEETEQEKFEKRFNKETYESLSEYGKIAYSFMAEHNPTPGRYHTMIDKDPDYALQYIFDQDNTLVAKIVVGYGTDLGDEPNTSIEYKKGRRTSTPGVFLYSNAATPEDLKMYGPDQYSLFGYSIRGDKQFYGQHRTYPKEFKTRTIKLKSPTPADNAFSDGCFNTMPEDFPILRKNFIGDFGELVFVLPDKVTKENIKKGRVKFDMGKLMEMITPMMIAMADENDKIYSQRVEITMQEIGQLQTRLEQLKIKIDKENSEYQKDRTNVTKQKQVERTKKEIKETIDKIGKSRGVLTETERQREKIKTRKSAAEKIIAVLQSKKKEKQWV